MKRIIFLDAGHSNKDPGASAPSDEYEYESQINMVIRDFLVPELKEQGFEVKLIPDNKNLSESYLWVNARTSNINDGLALGVHCNKGGGKGAETFYYYYESSKRIAQALIDEFCKETGLKNRGAKSDTLARFGELSWIRGTTVWATLIEVGFLDNESDLDFIINNIDSVAKGIAKGVCAIYRISYKEKEEFSLSREEIKKQIIELVKKL